MGAHKKLLLVVKCNNLLLLRTSQTIIFCEPAFLIQSSQDQNAGYQLQWQLPVRSTVQSSFYVLFLCGNSMKDDQDGNDDNAATSFSSHEAIAATTAKLGVSKKRKRNRDDDQDDHYAADAGSTVMSRIDGCSCRGSCLTVSTRARTRRCADLESWSFGFANFPSISILVRVWSKVDFVIPPIALAAIRTRP